MTMKKRTKKSLLVSLGCFIGGAVTGYMTVGMGPLAIDWQMGKLYMTYLSALLASLSMLLVGVTAYRSHRFYQTYHQLEDEAGDGLYRRLELSLDELAVATTLSYIFSILLILLHDSRQIGHSHLLFMGIAYLLLTFAGQFYARRLQNGLRGIEAPFFASMKEVKHNILQQDEAELMANYRMAHDIVLTLQHGILPLTYLVLAILSDVTERATPTCRICPDSQPTPLYHLQNLSDVPSILQVRRNLR